MRKLFSWLRNGGFTLILFAVALVLLWGTFAPVGTLVWWLDGGRDKLERRSKEIEALLNRDSNSEEDAAENSCYIIFLTGIGDVSGEELSSGEEEFIDRLEQEQPQCVIVSDVFPYSAANQDVGGQQIFEFLWRVTEKAEGWLELTQYLLEFRNVWRMAISADDRYGRIYNPAIAVSIVERMEQQQSIPSSSQEPIKLILMGKSGGTQVALGAAPYLDEWLNADIYVISFGGVFDGNEGFDAVNHVYHLRGDRDWTENIGGIVFPSRWLWTVGSPYNRARREGRYTAYDSGPHQHSGDEGYFGQEIAEDDKTYVELTIEQVNQLPIWQE